jgi:hypothetical protein
MLELASGNTATEVMEIIHVQATAEVLVRG